MRGQVPLDCIRCGFVAWEMIQARQRLHPLEVVEIPPQMEIERHLPRKLRQRSHGEDLMNTLREIKKSRLYQSDRRTIRLALINGFGTMLGDNLVGASAMSCALKDAKSSEELSVEVDVYLAWNAVQGTECILRRSGLFNRIEKRSISLFELKSYDAYWDFSSLLRMEGYDEKNFHDFYLDHLGFNAEEVESARKIPSVHISRAKISEAKRYLNMSNASGLIVFMQLHASTEARSIPDEAARPLISGVLEKTSATIVYCAKESFLTEERYRGRLINLGEWTTNDLDRYFALIYLSNAVISVDTLAMHVAIGLNKPGIGLFSLSPPNLRLQYANNIDGFVIPGAEHLQYWKRHKSDLNWGAAEADYLKSWMRLDADVVTDALIKKLNNERVPSSTGDAP